MLMSGHTDKIHTIYLAGGCFWGLEAYMKKLPGVLDTVVGYANGTTEIPPMSRYAAAKRAMRKR